MEVKGKEGETNKKKVKERWKDRGAEGKKNVGREKVLGVKRGVRNRGGISEAKSGERGW